MAIRKIWCEIVEGAVYSDRCLYKLCRVIEDNKTCESCVIRELEEAKSLKAKAPGISNVSDVSDGIKDRFDIFDVSDRKRARKRRRRRRSKPAESETAKQMYSIQELTELLGKAERTLRTWAERGKVPAAKVGIKWRFPKEEVDRWLSERRGGTLGMPKSEEGKETPEFQKTHLLPGNQGNPEKA